MTNEKLPSGVRRLLRLPWTRARAMRDMDDELRAHLDMRIDELRTLGLNQADAEVEALRRFGDTDAFRMHAARRAARQARWRSIAEWLDEWMQDVRFSGRQFRRNAGFTALAVVTLALGIGANTAIFSVVHRLLIAPLPYSNGDRIVKLVRANGENVFPPTRSMVRAWHDRSRSLEMVAAVTVDALFLQDFGDTPDTIPAFVTSNYLTLLGLRPALGRGFTQDDEKPGAPPVAMISHGKWRREYGGSGDVLGTTLRVPGRADRSYTIIGVTPSGMSIPMSPSQGVNHDLRQAAPAIWLPASLNSIGYDHVFAKLKPGVSADDASAELQAILDSEPASTTAGSFRAASQMRVRAMRAQDFLDPREAQTVRVLFVAVAVLLLIACANVANLLMSRAWTRRREFAVRTALGAGRARLTRQVLTESVMLALAGGAAGVGVAWAALQVIMAFKPVTLEELTGAQIEQTVLLWSAGISVLTGILFGCAPALFAAARSAGDVLRSETRTASGGTAARRMRSTLIVLEIAMSLVLLVGAGLLVRSFFALQATPLHFQPRGLVSADVMLMFNRDWTREARDAQRSDLLERFRAIPGVSEATIGMMPGLGWRVASQGPSLTSDDGNSVDEHLVTFVTPEYFRVAGIRIVEGRLPDSAAASAPVQEVIVNRTLARRISPDRGILGTRLAKQGGPPATSGPYTVVGVIDDIEMPGRRSAAGMADLYAPMPSRLGELPVLLRSTLSEEEVVSAIRRVVAEYDPTLRSASGMPWGAILRSVTPGESYVRESFAPTRFAMALLVAFALIALLLSAVGLYGVVAYAVSRRTHEIGVRVALGADRHAVQRLILGGGLRLTVLGLILGLGAAVASTRLLAGLLYGVSAVDPVSFAAIALLVLTIASLASWVPTRRATRIDPMEALRVD